MNRRDFERMFFSGGGGSGRYNPPTYGQPSYPNRPVGGRGMTTGPTSGGGGFPNPYPITGPPPPSPGGRGGGPIPYYPTTPPQGGAVRPRGPSPMYDRDTSTRRPNGPMRPPQETDPYEQEDELGMLKRLLGGGY